MWKHRSIAWGKDFYLESTRFVMVRDSAYMWYPHKNLKRKVHLKNLNIA